MAKLISRSENDLKCFISYINLANNEPVITNKEFFEVVKVINDIVEDVQQQESVINIMIEEQFEFLNNGGEKRSSEFINEKTTERTNNILEDKVHELEKSVKHLAKRMEASEKDRMAMSTALSEKEKIIAEQTDYFRETELLNEKMRLQQYALHQTLTDENKDLKREVEQYKAEQASRERNKARFCIIGCILLIILITVPVFYELYDMFICKNLNPISLRLFNHFINGSLADTENKMDYYWGTVGKTAGVIVTFIDFLLGNVIIKKYKAIKQNR